MQEWQAGRVMDPARRFCTFFADGLWLGVAVEEVQEVLREQLVAPVPLAPPEIAGLMNLRGQIVTVIDLRRRLGLQPRAVGQSAVNVVASSGGGLVSLLVDEVGEVVEAAQDRYEIAPEPLPAESRRMVPGVYKLREGLLHVLELSAVTASPQAEEGRTGNPSCVP